MCLLITFIQKQSTVVGGELMNLIESDNLRWKYFAGSDKFDRSIDYAVFYPESGTGWAQRPLGAGCKLYSD